MIKQLLTTLFIFTAIVLSGCGVKVEVPPAHVAKVMTKDGYQANLIPTSKFRLDPCWTYCDRLVLLDVSDRAFSENLTIFMPKDKLNLTVAVRTTLSVNPKKTEELFNSISPEGNKDNEFISLIPLNKAYTTYAQQIALTESREYLSQYSIAEIASSVETVNNELRARLTKALQERSPFSVRYVGITNIEYPKIITDAQENAAKRREQIQQEEAQLEISKVTLERDLQEARLTRQIEKEKAETEAEAQRIQAQTVDNRVLELRRLENERLWIEKWSGVLPTTTLGNTGLMYNINK
jgi:regulator of protease activity HflC (stomatin/prohibitin superfamily)